MQVEPLDATFGATVRDVELADLDDDTWAELHATWLEHALLIFPGQFLTLDAQNAFARRFGDLELEAFPLANIDADGTVHTSTDDDVVKMLRGNEGWHHDSTFMPVQAKGAVFSAEIVPTAGGATGWADMRAAYDELDEATRERLAGLSAYHSLRYSQGRAGYLPSKATTGGYLQGGSTTRSRRCARWSRCTRTPGVRTCCIGRHAYGIVGMDPDASEQLLDRINVWACQGTRTYHHQWEVGDVVVWDNRRLMHRATPFDLTEPRRMWHTRIAGEPAPRPPSTTADRLSIRAVAGRTDHTDAMIRLILVFAVVFLFATFPATWLLMLFLGNAGVNVSYWGALPLGILVSALLGGVSSSHVPSTI